MPIYLRMKSTIGAIILALLFMSLSWKAEPEESAQLDETDTQAIVKAKFISFFSLYCDWPQERKEGDFVIAVLGNKNLYEELVSKYSSDAVGSQHLKVIFIKALDKLAEAHIICVSKENSKLLPDISKKFQGTASIIVTQCDDCLNTGAHFNFVVEDNKLLYELDQPALEGEGVLVGNKLIQFAVNR